MMDDRMYLGIGMFHLGAAGRARERAAPRADRGRHHAAHAGRIAAEEAVFREGFGTRHVEYARRVPALIPLVGAR
jgi:protein-S-isoprenylcysteine O-methyltransferase Ste14